MSAIARRWIAVGALFGAIGVGLGAYGAHGLSKLLENQLGYAGADLEHRLDIFRTAVHYQMLHAVALVITGLALQQKEARSWRFAAWAFLAGILIFSGLLKVMTFAGPEWKWLGAIVPIGGLSMILGWLALAIGAIKK
jgi:uncharacterized membrane protein YgdD (TMEM256/DUF423 family)